MSIKIFGAVLVVSGCGGIGFKLAASHLCEEKSLRNLLSILDYIECELQYRLTPLPVLCRRAAEQSAGGISKVFDRLATELEAQTSPNVEHCMKIALLHAKNIPRLTRESFELLGRSLGKFDIEGQLKELDAVRQECRRNLEALSQNRDIRLRTYQTLGLCIGAAIAILLF